MPLPLLPNDVRLVHDLRESQMGEVLLLNLFPLNGASTGNLDERGGLLVRPDVALHDLSFSLKIKVSVKALSRRPRRECGRDALPIHSMCLYIR